MELIGEDMCVDSRDEVGDRGVKGGTKEEEEEEEEESKGKGIETLGIGMKNPYSSTP